MTLTTMLRNNFLAPIDRILKTRRSRRVVAFETNAILMNAIVEPDLGGVRILYLYVHTKPSLQYLGTYVEDL